MQRKKAPLSPSSNELIRQVLADVLASGIAELPDLSTEIVIGKNLRIAWKKHNKNEEKRLQKKQTKRVKKLSKNNQEKLRWWSLNSPSEKLPPNWKADVIDLASHRKTTGGGVKGNLLHIITLQRA